MNEDRVHPECALLLRSVPLDKDTNQNRDVHAGWLVGQMDMAACSLAGRQAHGRTATVSISEMDFLSPIRVGAEVSFHGREVKRGNSSIHILIEVWTRDHTRTESRKVSEATFVIVAIDDRGHIRKLPAD